MVAIWNSLRPAKDKNAKMAETPCPPDKLHIVLPAWEFISTQIDAAKRDIDTVDKILTELLGMSLAATAASSASLRVGKLTKFAKVRDLDKCLNGFDAAKTKTNLAWAGIETMKGNKLIDDLIPILQSVLGCLDKADENLQMIDSVLNPKSLAEINVAEEKKKQAERVKAYSDKKKKKKKKKAVDAAAAGAAGEVPESDSSFGDSSKQALQQQTDKGKSISSNVSATASATASATSQGSYLSVKTSMKVNQVARKFKEAKIVVDVEKQNAEFGGDPMALLNMERAQPIGEPVIEVSERVWRGEGL